MIRNTIYRHSAVHYRPAKTFDANVPLRSAKEWIRNNYPDFRMSSSFQADEKEAVICYTCKYAEKSGFLPCNAMAKLCWTSEGSIVALSTIAHKHYIDTNSIFDEVALNSISDGILTGHSSKSIRRNISRRYKELELDDIPLPTLEQIDRIAKKERRRRRKRGDEEETQRGKEIRPLFTFGFFIVICVIAANVLSNTAGVE